MRIYRVIAYALHGLQWSRYTSSWHRTLADALVVFLLRQQEGFDSVALVPARAR